MRIRGEDAIGRMTRNTKHEAVVIEFKILQGVTSTWLSKSPAAACPSFFRRLICDGSKVMFFLATIMIPRERPSIVPACRALDLPQMAMDVCFYKAQ
jgi:hypothetical protein